MSHQFPSSFESVRSAVIAFMKGCDPHMEKLRDRQLLKEEIARLSGTNAGLGTGLKNTGMQRSVDELGRLVIPKELRTVMGIENGMPVEFFIEESAGVVYIQRYNMEKCAICGDDSSLTEIKGKYVCEDCVSKIFEGDA